MIVKSQSPNSLPIGKHAWAAATMQFNSFWRTRPLQYLAQLLFSLALVVFSVFALALRKLAQTTREARAESWPSANGAITTCDVKVVYGRFIEHALGQEGYAYSIDGNYYSGYFVRQYRDEQLAWVFVDSLKDKQVLIRYKAGDPQVSVLRAGDQVGGLQGEPS
jgi:hypothetical protein